MLTKVRPTILVGIAACTMVMTARGQVTIGVSGQAVLGDASGPLAGGVCNNGNCSIGQSSGVAFGTLAPGTYELSVLATARVTVPYNGSILWQSGDAYPSVETSLSFGSPVQATWGTAGSGLPSYYFLSPDCSPGCLYGLQTPPVSCQLEDYYYQNVLAGAAGYQSVSYCASLAGSLGALTGCTLELRPRAYGIQSFNAQSGMTIQAGMTSGLTINVGVPTTYALTWNILATNPVGTSQNAAVLPTEANTFSIPQNCAGAQCWFDPPLASGYTFAAQAPTMFTRIVDFPVGVDADGAFIVRANGQLLGAFAVGQSVDFVALLGAPVSAFEVLGIEPLVDGSNYTAFPIRLEFSNGMGGQFSMTPINTVPPSVFCQANGSSTPCPCGNNGAANNGCGNSLFPNGAHLAATGTSSVAADSTLLTATSMTGAIAIFFQGGTQVPAAIVDDGIGCVGGPVIRLGAKSVPVNSSSYPQVGDASISVRGAIPPTGGTYYYQCFYRNASTVFCPPATSNRTNGVTITWTL